MEPGTKLSKFDGGKKVNESMYQSLVGSLCYLTCTRPDISFSMGIVSRFMKDPVYSHWKALKRILRYIRGTESLRLHYSHTKECKLIGYSDSDCHAIWLRNLLIEMENQQDEATQILVNNKSAIELAKNPVNHERSKHIDIRFHFIRDHVKEGRAQLVHVPSRDQVADIFTKPLPTVLLENFKRLIGMKDRRELSLRNGVENKLN
ncbi:hypothetical protein Tco_0571735 [Tanacetum coccineum]